MGMKKKIKQDARKKKPKAPSKPVKKTKISTQKKGLKKGPAQKKKPVRKTTTVSRPAKKMVKKVAKKGVGAKPKAKSKGTVKTVAAKPQKSSRMKAPKGRVASSGKTSGMNRTDTPKEHARQELLKKFLIVREAKEEIAKYTKGEANQLAETALDDGDWSVIDLSQDIILRRLETHRESLLGIDEALMKLKEGSYGICEDCGGEISAERLNVMPFAIYCKDCREKREELEKATREDTIS
jgi:DnaK suppressor protein